MELLNHLGIVPQHNSRFLTRIRGFAIMYILVKAIILYHFIHVFCYFLAFSVPDTSRNIKRIASVSFWQLCIYFMKQNNVQINVTGEDIDSDSALLICNHRSLADHIVIAYLARHTNNAKSTKEASSQQNNLTLPEINFFSWFLLWKVPNIRLLLNFAKCDENWELEDDLICSVFEKTMSSKFPQWIVLFPEVNIWSQENAYLQKIQSEKYFLPILSNLLYPRFSGFFNAVHAIKSASTYRFNELLDITIAYQSSEIREDDSKIYTPTLMEIFASESQITVTINISTKPISRIPIKRMKLERYLEHVWRSKDELLSQLQESTKKSSEATSAVITMNSPQISNQDLQSN